ncbi:MAG: hypothetical protein Q7V88_09155 [Actinomycetota bacterium]|nr:hypothetical protein [Actinomycetota bacterium]
MKPAHHQGRFDGDARRVRQTANSTPLAVCWRCGRTLREHPAAKSGKPQVWTAGHTVDGDPNARPWLNVTRQPPAGSWLAPEASGCNFAAGARRTNAWRGNPHSQQWFST